MFRHLSLEAGTAHLAQRAVLGVPGGLRQQETHRLAEARSDHCVRVFHETNESTENRLRVAVVTHQFHMLAEMRQSF